jgi:branched-chain amino acid aminotransferase
VSISLYRLVQAQLARAAALGCSLDAASSELPAGVFTTMRTHGGDRIVGLSAHLDRLVMSLDLLESERRVDLLPLRQALRQVLATEAWADLRLRLTVPFGGDEVFIAVEPFEPFPERCYREGVCCATVRIPRGTPRAKRTEFIAVSRRAKSEAPAGIHELLLLDHDDLILEGITSNFFAVKHGELRTAERGVLEGVTRRIVLDAAPLLLPVRLDPVARAELGDLTEAFITSSSREVMPVVAVDGLAIGPGKPGPVTHALAAAYNAHLEEAAEWP